MTLPIGSLICNEADTCYFVEKLLSKEQDAAVYLVSEQRSRQHKFILKETSAPCDLSQARIDHARLILLHLTHRALPRVYQFFHHPQFQRVYLLMEQIDGRDLATLQKEQPGQRFSLLEALSLMAPIFDAVIYLHKKAPPLVHPDIQPRNIIARANGRGTVLVGLGMEMAEGGSRAANNPRYGSSGFAAPEQYAGEATPGSNLYSLGATLYTLLTGQTPPDGLLRTTTREMHDLLVSMFYLAPEVSPKITEAIETAMAIRSDERFESVEQFWQVLTTLAPVQPEQLARLYAPDTFTFLPRQRSKGTPPAASSNQQQPGFPRPVGPDVFRPGYQPAKTADTRASAQSAGFSADKPRRPPANHQKVPLTALLNHPQTSLKRERRLFIISLGSLALLLVLIVGASILEFSLKGGQTSPALHPTTSVVSSDTTDTAGGVSGYPTLATSYLGTVTDLLAGEKTAMYLTNIQQQQGDVSGMFQGLGLIGPFTGTVSPNGQIQFTVSIHSGQQTLDFSGTIKVGGDIVGTFVVLDKNGNRTGEYGPWNVAASN